MPTFRFEKFTVTQSDGLAQNSIFFPTENEPIFRYRRLGLNPERGAHFAKIQSKANSWYAIQKTGVNNGSDCTDCQGASNRESIFRSSNPLQKTKERTHFSAAATRPECEAPLAKIQSKSNFLCSRQGSQRAGTLRREDPWRRQ